MVVQMKIIQQGSSIWHLSAPGTFTWYLVLIYVTKIYCLQCVWTEIPPPPPPPPPFSSVLYIKPTCKEWNKNEKNPDFNIIRTLGMSNLTIFHSRLLFLIGLDTQTTMLPRRGVPYLCVSNMLLVLSITFYIHYNIWRCMCSTGPFQYIGYWKIYL